ncbi:MAG TPA: hypothetical protein VHF58_06185 [Solirubrobacterales bacterium]|nr:hypothetical protein [Solirubrobacterales bacterium]
MRPEDALKTLSKALRSERSVVSAHVTDPDAGEAPALGLLAAAGPRAAEAPADYALIVESVREGYLLHYGRSRLVASVDPDLALLAGDYLYALGLERLAGLGDLEAIAELSDLISLSAQIHDGSRDASRVGAESSALWLAVATTVGAGPSAAIAEAKGALRSGADDAAERLWAAARELGERAGLGRHIQVAAQAIDFAADFTSSSG